MAVEVDVLYQGELRCRATHGPSGDQLTTDAPVDNHGKGESFSPTDLVATALGACSLTIMGIVAQRNGLDIEGATAHVIKEMATQPVRRIGALKVTITIPAEKAAKLTGDDRKKLQEGALHCPVHKSLHPDIAAPIEFIFGN
ncbi:MAG: OsmC family protein [Planctomycetaceae bacterium]|jgi:putative redox protein